MNGGVDLADRDELAEYGDDGLNGASVVVITGGGTVSCRAGDVGCCLT